MWCGDLDEPLAMSCLYTVASTPFLGSQCFQTSVGWVVSKFQREDGGDITSSRKRQDHYLPLYGNNATVTAFIVLYKQLEVLQYTC
jgi:hypothetical protein